jgi:zinc transporter
MTMVEDPPGKVPEHAQKIGDGLVWGFHFNPAGNPEAVTAENLPEVLGRGDGWLWLNLDLGDDHTAATINALPSLPPPVLHMLLSRDDKPKVDTFGTVVAGIVNDYEKRPQPDARYGVRWRFVLLPNLVVTARPARCHVLAQVHDDVLNGRCFPNPLDLLAALVNEFSITSHDLLIEIGARLNECEEKLLDHEENEDSKMLGMARRNLLYLHRQVIPVFGILTNMLLQRPDWFDEDSVVEFRRIAERLDALHDDINLGRERAHTLQEDFHAQEAEQTNRRLTVLTVVSALLLPPTFITGLFGMNVGGLPLEHDSLGFFVAGAVMTASIVGMLIILRRIRLI